MNSSEKLIEAALQAAQASFGESNKTKLVQILPDRTVDDAIKAALAVFVTDLRAMLYPEFHPGYDPEHVFWSGLDPNEIANWPGTAPPQCFEWSADTTEWVGQWANGLYDRLVT